MSSLCDTHYHDSNLFYRFVAPMVKLDLDVGKNVAKKKLKSIFRGFMKSVCQPSLKLETNAISLSTKENEKRLLCPKQVN